MHPYRDEVQTWIYAFGVVNDTIGAGDSFTGTLVASLIEGLPIREAHARAVRVSAYVCTQAGAMPVLPEEVKG